jgi:hypothetical protein
MESLAKHDVSSWPPDAATPGTFMSQVLIVIAIIVAAAAAYLQREADPDLWGHLRYGQFFAEHGPGDHADPFAYTSAGQHWHAHEWLAQWLLWQAYALGGPAGLLVLKLIVGGATMWFLYRAIRLGSDNPIIWVPVFALAAVMLGRWYVFRPQLFTYCFFAYFVFVLLSYLLGKRAWLWTLPPIIALWSNLHGGFLAGLGAIGLVLCLRVVQTWYRAGLRPRQLFVAVSPLAIILALSFGASLLNPFGLDLWRYILTEMTHDTNRLYNDEWMPLWRWDRHEWSIMITLLFLAALIAVGAFAMMARARIGDIPAGVWLLSCLPLTWMAFGAIRHVPVLTLWGGPVLGLLAGAAARRWSATPLGRLGWLGLTALIAVPTSLAVYVICADPAPRIKVATDKFPSGAVAFLKSNDLRGNVYVALEWGSYLTFYRYPYNLVSMDGRNVTVFPSNMVRENFAYRLLEGQDPDLPMRYDTDYLLLPVDAPVVTALRQDQRWRILYEDKVCILLIRVDERH